MYKEGGNFMTRCPGIEMYKRDAIQAARDLGYDSEVIQKLKNAQTQNEITNIMICARNEFFK